MDDDSDDFEAVKEDACENEDQKFDTDNVSLEDNEEYFEAKMGGEAVRDLLRKLDIKEEMKKLTEVAKGKFSMQKKEEALKRLRIFKKFDNTLNFKGICSDYIDRYKKIVEKIKKK